ncbi:hypothetical protein APHCR_0662 [Anaplasma phagocytophilum str. CR1007]|uniref:Uncharacterized protein n=1 Tax=Anaplasma phagocytophilum (strain HZ) TaxID=212042 RepID=Q2GIX1_ANAPZ|nr:hypothetical protein APH_1138 [Anaplasma phagocytophilum str. HZ]KJV98019.1 hypothetical protein OTSANNIE_1455 [Anaplasma phagocytophilum str. Annie]KJZ98602.1 hypothetical protein APHCR_0662 [Anaplasma phagocytophilum str. CR1007]KJZ99666.1 hypothetical protein APHDU1_0460 [Anaplasma phagocytophilum]
MFFKSLLIGAYLLGVHDQVITFLVLSTTSRFSDIVPLSKRRFSQ